MRHRVLFAALFLLLPTAFAQQRRAPSKTKPQTAQAAVGCLDQRGETYVLTGDRELRRIVTLQGDGFSDDNFARYLGHKVKVQGRLSEPGSSVFKVREITTISETCKPEAP
jgi:hypothetical protein